MSTTTPVVHSFTSDNVAGAAPQVIDAVALAASGQAAPYCSGS
ncbi:hypothetical protein GCM10010193_28580 [Kitasatospora atroaurantiaca]|uniref:Uncharacterized protein n=1 Tax=Kitasatospora atroaurantiaca TaxID=285545 RepID=A0A561EIY9_9ACTN|nr:hypothetical protein [Kitasatospora atroaurantiaca]TWE15585.1 hypothetical protein FB465_0489 [Kitasatospora atroaurantiaca]